MWVDGMKSMFVIFRGKVNTPISHHPGKMFIKYSFPSPLRQLFLKPTFWLRPFTVAQNYSRTKYRRHCLIPSHVMPWPWSQAREIWQSWAKYFKAKVVTFTVQSLIYYQSQFLTNILSGVEKTLHNITYYLPVVLFLRFQLNTSVGQF